MYPNTHTWDPDRADEVEVVTQLLGDMQQRARQTSGQVWWTFT
jgi:hypothetical protein